MDNPQGENSHQPLRLPELKRSIILLFSTYFKLTKIQIKHSATIARLKTLSNLYEVNSSRHYKCKGLFTEEFQSILELQNHQIPKVKTGLANHCNNNWRYLSDSRQSSTTFLNTIGNNKHEDSSKSSCHLRLSLNTTQMCESVFQSRTTIDHTRHVCNTLNLKITHKENQFKQSKGLLLMSCSKFLLIEGLNTE